MTFTATDDRGASCDSAVTVCVPLTPGGTCTDDGLRHDALAVCRGPRAEPAGAPTAALRVERPAPGEVVIEFDLPSAATVELENFDIAGRTVSRVAHGAYGAGTHRLAWSTSGLPAGRYFARMRAGEATFRRTIALTK